MFHFMKRLFIPVLLISALVACVPALPPSSVGPNASTVPAQTPTLLPATSQPTSTQQPAAPTATPTSLPATVAATPTNLIRYQGPNAYRSTPTFSVDYDPSVWEFVEKDGSGREPRLDHRSIAQCSIWLKAGPMGAQPVSTVQLAGYEWTIFQVQPDIIMYSIPWNDISFIFGLILPEPYTPDVKSPCQQALEDVMQMFQITAD